MLVCKIPKNNVCERSYILDTVLGEFLGLEYRLVHDEVTDWELCLDNGGKLIIQDHFFNAFSKDLEYLDKAHIPSDILTVKNGFVPEGLPVIYGNGFLEISGDLQPTIMCGADIFASSFFMLSRWEEYANTTRDEHGRFPASASLALKHDFLHRPIVNEYVEMLWGMLEHLGISQSRKQQKKELFLTHDVDHILFWRSKTQLFRIVAGDVIKRKSLSLAWQRCKEYVNVRKGLAKDPYDTFDWLMDQSETLGIKSRFYFMCGGVTIYDNHYRIDEHHTVKLLENIKQRGHIIGIHPSYNTYNDLQQLKKEKETLEECTGLLVAEGRQHYLRFEVPTTWQCWEDAGLKVDSTCGYADREGFRCGTGDTFGVFNILSRQALRLKERPLIYMDDTPFYYQNKNGANYGLEDILALIRQRTSISLLWHNSYLGHLDIYKQLIEHLKEKTFNG